MLTHCIDLIISQLQIRKAFGSHASFGLCTLNSRLGVNVHMFHMFEVSLEHELPRALSSAARCHRHRHRNRLSLLPDKLELLRRQHRPLWRQATAAGLSPKDLYQVSTEEKPGSNTGWWVNMSVFPRCSLCLLPLLWRSVCFAVSFGFGAPVGVRPFPLFCFRVRVWFRASLTCSPRGVLFTSAAHH